MKQAIEKYLQYLQSVRNSSPHTILNYGHDLEQFMAYLSPPGEQPPALPKITHLIIRRRRSCRSEFLRSFPRKR